MTPAETRKNTPIQAIISDFGGVICTFDYGIFCRRLAHRTGISAERIHGCSFGGELQISLESGQLSGPAYHQRLMAQLAIRVPYEDFCETYGDIFNEVPAVVDLLTRLRPTHRLVLLSDTNEIHFGFVRPRLRALRLFDHFVLSYEIGAMKPDARIYQEAVRLAGVPASACVFIDDRLANVEGARRAGLQAVQFQSVEQCTRELKTLGVDTD